MRNFVEKKKSRKILQGELMELFKICVKMSLIFLDFFFRFLLLIFFLKDDPKIHK